jgi:Tfp pilus assembly protein PilO
MAFIQALIFCFLIVGFLFGIGYWFFFFLSKSKPYLKYDFKYKILKKKYNENEVKTLMDYDQADLTKDEVEKFLLVKGNLNPKKAKELVYIYTQIQKRKLKGGLNKNDKQRS